MRKSAQKLAKEEISNLLSSGASIAAESATQCAYDATSSIAAVGLDATRKKWESHWASALSDSDFDFLINTAHCTSLRLPVGYFTLGPRFTANTPFGGLASQVYTNAWLAVQQLCLRLHANGIGVLLDMHALPGGANDAIHSGTSSNSSELWGNSSNLSLAKSCLLFIATDVTQGRIPGCIGIQLCNEAAFGARGMFDWYTDILQSISQIDASIPLYISDAWDLNAALSWAAEQNSAPSRGNLLVVDTHRYYTFTDADKSQTPQQIIARIPSELSEATALSGSVFDRGAAQVCVGEWSCVLDGDTWAKAQGASRDDLVRQFGNAQSQQWKKKASGCFFWTMKMDWMEGGEWGFVEMTKEGACLAPLELSLSFADVRGRIRDALQARDGRKAVDRKAHITYWSQTSPGKHFEHWRFEQGWDLGFSDAVAFFSMRANGGIRGSVEGADKIGGLEIWIRKRLRESGMRGGFVWEWEQGFRQGLAAFYTFAGV